MEMFMGWNKKWVKKMVERGLKHYGNIPEFIEDLKRSTKDCKEGLKKLPEGPPDGKKDKVWVRFYNETISQNQAMLEYLKQIQS